MGGLGQKSLRRFLLRERTAHSHATLDAAVGGFDSRSDYARYLSGLHAFRAPLEEALAKLDWPASFGDWRPEPIAALIEADMDDLGLPRRDVLPPAGVKSDLPELLGALYVLEGSSLGARVLVKRAAALGLGETFGARHLVRQAAGAGWLGLLALLDMPIANLPEDEIVDRMAASAIAAFDRATGIFASLSPVEGNRTLRASESVA